MMKSPTPQISPSFQHDGDDHDDENDDAADDENGDDHNDDPHHADFPSLEARSDHVEIEVGDVRGVRQNLLYYSIVMIPMIQYF